MDAADSQRRDAHRLPFSNLERDLDNAWAQRAYNRIDLYVGEAAAPVERFDTLHVARELDGIETATLADDRKSGKRRWQSRDSRGERRGPILDVPGKAEHTHFAITAFACHVLRGRRHAQERQHASHQCRFSRAESPVCVA